MLYVNTNTHQEYTAYQALTLDAPVGAGVIAPMRLPHFCEKDFEIIFKHNFVGIVSFVIGKFFPLHLDVEKDAVKYFSTISLDKKTLLVSFDEFLDVLEQYLAKQICVEIQTPSVWARCAIRISAIFALFGELNRAGVRSVDIAISADDIFSFVPSVYCKVMGLPIRNIIVGTSGEGEMWNYLHNHQEGAGDIFAYFSHGNLNLSDNMHLIDEMMPFVVSNDRAKDMVAKIKHAFTKKVTTATAISYGALQDYRAITGENRTTIVFNI